MTVVTSRRSPCLAGEILLQRVHGRMTVVTMVGCSVPYVVEKLQRVHGRMTVVTHRLERAAAVEPVASTGPRSDDRGYGQTARILHGYAKLQRVHGRMTVVTELPSKPALQRPWCFNGSTVG